MESFELLHTSPNPFNPSTTIEYKVVSNSTVSLNIIGLQGRIVSKLINSEMEAGSYHILWDAGNYPSGMYLVRFDSNETILTKKIMLIK
jgi:hypothetical protein